MKNDLFASIFDNDLSSKINQSHGVIDLNNNIVRKETKLKEHEYKINQKIYI